jgi:teichuronic acid biosynthesis glycosyltransferase TuaC
MLFLRSEVILLNFSKKDNAEIRVLVISRLYPNRFNNSHGIFVHRQIEHLIQNRCKAIVVAPKPWSPKILWFREKWRDYGLIPKHDRLNNIEIHYPNYLRFPGKCYYPFSGILVFFCIRKFIGSIKKSFQFEIIYSNTDVTDGHASILLGKRFKVPVVLMSRGELNVWPYTGKLANLACKTVLNKSDQIITVSNDLRQIAENLARPKVKIQVVYNGCDTEMFRNLVDTDHIRQDLKLPKDSMVLMYLGSVEEDKGVYELFEAFNVLIKRYKRLHLVMIGDGPEKAAINLAAKESGCQNRILIPGKKDNSELPLWLNACDIFVFPSHYEGLPNSVMEAMACERPVVATNAGGIPEIVEEGVTGYLVKVGDVESLVLKIDALLSNESLRKTMGMKGRKKLLSHSSWDRNALKLVGILRNSIKHFG